ncbi:MAG TPA: hypothetical protein VG432_10570 [Gemmatimonadaceae bacterium]|nr:hypothetical protein [Gemmatimonadaceae bacterium]
MAGSVRLEGFFGEARREVAVRSGVGECQRVRRGFVARGVENFNSETSEMAFKPAVADIIGKTIEHIVVKEGDRQPRSQVFLVFTDGSYYEFYSATGAIVGAGGLDVGGIEAVRGYLPGQRVVYER